MDVVNQFFLSKTSVKLASLMKNIEYAELLLDYGTVLLGVWKMFHYSPKQKRSYTEISSKYLW